MSDNNTNHTDLSAGNASQEETVLTQVLLSEQQQKAFFRKFSFIGAWIFSVLFFVTVISFSWGIMFCPNAFLLTKAIHSEEQSTSPKEPETKNVFTTPNIEETESTKTKVTLFNQFLIMLALLSAIGATLAIAVMRFSFSNDKQSEQDSSMPPISPVANSLAELLNQLIDLIKKKSG